MKNEKLPPGVYYIGDPCYVIDNDRWDEYLEPFHANEAQGGVFDFDGFKCAAYYTQFGDGVYELEPTGHPLPVDSGSIGAIPIALAHGDPGMGAVVTFDKPFTCVKVRGRLYFGSYSVETEDTDIEE